MNHFRHPVFNKVHNNLMPDGSSHPPARPPRKERRRRLEFGFRYAKGGGQTPFYGDMHITFHPNVSPTVCGGKG